MSWTECKAVNKTEERREPAIGRISEMFFPLPCYWIECPCQKKLLFRVTVKLYVTGMYLETMMHSSGLIFRESVHVFMSKRKGTKK